MEYTWGKFPDNNRDCIVVKKNGTTVAFILPAGDPGDFSELEAKLTDKNISYKDKLTQ